MIQSWRFRTEAQLYDNISWKQLINLIRLHIEHCQLNSYLHRHKIIKNASCDYNCEVEIVKYFLLICKMYEKQRKKLKKKMSERNMRTKNFLENSKLIKDTLKYVKKTKRFNFDWLIEYGINRLKNTFQRETARKRWIGDITRS